MGYEVRFDALDAMAGTIATGISNWNTQLEGAARSADALSKSDAMEGSGAENIRQYIAYVHGIVAESLATILQAHLSNCLLYKTDYQTNIDTGLHTVILEDELSEIKARTRIKQDYAGSTDEIIQDVLSTVSELCSPYFRGCGASDDAYDSLVLHMNRLDESIQALENDHLCRDFEQTERMIGYLSRILDDHLGKGREYKSSFSPESWARGENLQSLVVALQAQSQIREDQQEILEIAYRHEEERADALQKEQEEILEKQRQAQDEKWILVGVCAIGSVAAIAVIGLSGGTATPLVVGTVSAISGTVMSGGSTMIDQHYTGNGEYHWDEVGKSALIGGVTGFVTGYAGAGVSNAVTGYLTRTAVSSAIANVTINSSSRLARMVSYGAIGSVSQISSGVVSRGASSFVSTLILSEGDFIKSAEEAKESALNARSIIIDGAIGGASGSLRGIKEPGKIRPIYNEEDAIEDGPYIKNGKPNGRPGPTGQEKLEFEKKLYERQISKSKDGLLHDPNTGEVIDWRPGETRKGVVDFGHKSGLEYRDMFEKYKYGEISIRELKEFQSNPNNFQLEAPSANQSHAFEGVTYDQVPVSDRVADGIDSVREYSRILDNTDRSTISPVYSQSSENMRADMSGVTASRVADYILQFGGGL